MSLIAKSPIRRKCDPKSLSPRRKSLDAELYGLGHTLKHLQPPGGNENGVFDAYRLPPEVLTPKKKANDYLKSHVFDVDIESRPPSRLNTESTHEHLFLATPPKPIPALHNNMKSTVFDPDPPKKAPVIEVKRDPITGKYCNGTNDPRKTKEKQVRNPITFEGVPDNPVLPGYTQPSGGKCSLVLEYIE